MAEQNERLLEAVGILRLRVRVLHGAALRRSCSRWALSRRGRG